MNTASISRIPALTRDAELPASLRAIRHVDSGRRARRPDVGCPRAISPQDGSSIKPLSPRIGVSWDVFGDGRTALKGGASRYDRLEGITLVQPLNLRNIAYETCPWADANGDLVAQTSEIVMSRCTGALQPTLGNVDPGLKRPHQWEYTAMVQRQIGASTSVSLGYYGRRFTDLYTTVNALVPPSAYTPVTVVNPLTNSPMTVYNQDPSTRTFSKNLLTTVPNLLQTYNGVEVQVNTRMHNATVFGGVTIGRDYGDQDGVAGVCSTCADLNNPNNLINNTGAIGFDSTQIRRFNYRPPTGAVLGIDPRATGRRRPDLAVTTSIAPG